MNSFFASVLRNFIVSVRTAGTRNIIISPPQQPLTLPPFPASSSLTFAHVPAQSSPSLLPHILLLLLLLVLHPHSSANLVFKPRPLLLPYSPLQSSLRPVFSSYTVFLSSLKRQHCSSCSVPSSSLRRHTIISVTSSPLPLHCQPSRRPT